MQRSRSCLRSASFVATRRSHLVLASTIACVSLLAGSLSAQQAGEGTQPGEQSGAATSPAGKQAMHSMAGRDAPAGVMGSMMHHEGEWMIGVRVMRMHMDGNRDGREDLTEADVFGAGYEMVPQRMDNTMVMLDVMYGIRDDVTLMASVPYVFNSMDMRMSDAESFTMRARGLGGVQLGALVGLWQGDRQGLHLNAGISLPTGKVDATDDMPNCPDCKVDYPTQPGSGTWDLAPGLTWVAENSAWSWGATWLETLRLGKNSEDYAFGNRHELSVWGVRRWNEAVSTSVRLAGAAWGGIDGSDPDFDPTIAPTQDPDAQAGRRIDVLLGLGWQPRNGPLQHHRLAVEIGVPNWQDLDGPQLETDWVANLNWQFWF